MATVDFFYAQATVNARPRPVGGQVLLPQLLVTFYFKK